MATIGVINKVVLHAVQTYRKMWVQFTDGSQDTYAITGTLALLVQSYWQGKCPMGVVVDRLEECPEEVEADSVVVTQCVQWFRQRVR